MSDHPLEAIAVGTYPPSRRWVVRPRNCLGTCGWNPYPWEAIIVDARNAKQALRKAAPLAAKQRMGIKP